MLKAAIRFQILNFILSETFRHRQNSDHFFRFVLISLYFE